MFVKIVFLRRGDEHALCPGQPGKLAASWPLILLLTAIVRTHIQFFHSMRKKHESTSKVLFIMFSFISLFIQ